MVVVVVIGRHLAARAANGRMRRRGGGIERLSIGLEKGERLSAVQAHDDRWGASVGGRMDGWTDGYGTEEGKKGGGIEEGKDGREGKHGKAREPWGGGGTKRGYVGVI
jgi:hypothetical protein